MGVKIDAADLRAAGLEEHFTTLDHVASADSEGDAPNVAIVSEPFGGRDALCSYVLDALDDPMHVTFPSTATLSDLPDFDAHDAIVLSDCHALFARRIGGFEVLDVFLERIAASETTIVTTWNQYAWSYLQAVRDVGVSFDTVLSDPDLSARQTAALLTERYGPSLPAFVDTGEAGRVKSIGFEDYPVRIVGNWTVDVPRPKLNLEYLSTLSPRNDDRDTRAVVFRKIALLSNGNPGIATVLWERSVTDGEIAPAYVEALDRNPDLDDAEAFVLWTVLANDSRDREDLAALLEDVAVERTLGTLDQQGMVELTGDSVAIRPEALHAAVEHLRGRRLVW